MSSKKFHAVNPPLSGTEFEITINIVVAIRFHIFCVLKYCRSLERKERISSKRNGAIAAVAIVMLTMTYRWQLMLVDDIDGTRISALYSYSWVLGFLKMKSKFSSHVPTPNSGS